MTEEKKQPIRCACVNGALLEAPAYEPKENGRNWLAVIDVDGGAPGGLSRRFLEHGRGACLYLVEQLALFDAVEFGADRYRKRRWYGVVVAKTDDAVFFEEASSGAAAVVLARGKRVDPAARAEALIRQSEALEAQAAKLRQEAAAWVEAKGKIPA